MEGVADEPRDQTTRRRVWATAGELTTGAEVCAAWGITPQHLSYMVSSGSLIRISFGGEPRYPRVIVELGRYTSAALTLALDGLPEHDKHFFFVKQHNALGKHTVSTAVAAGVDLARIVEVARDFKKLLAKPC